MRQRNAQLPWWLPLLAWLPALVIAQHWPQSRLADLPCLVVPLYAGYRLWLAALGDPDRAFALSGIQTSVLWFAAVGFQVVPSGASLLAAGVILLAFQYAADGLPHRAAKDIAGVFLLSSLFLPLLTIVGNEYQAVVAVPRDEPEIIPQQPIFFIPLDLDPTGRRLSLLSLRDLDSDDDEALSLWSLDITNGEPTRAYQGFPFFLADWCPAGNSLTFMASNKPWLEDDGAAFGVLTAPYRGGASRWVLPVPEDGSSWLYPQWSKQGDLIASWLTGAKSAESYVVSAHGGEPQQVSVQGCRLALFGAWQADGPGSFVITERGLFLVPAQGKPRRLVPSGEAPLDPFPLVVPEGVSPSGQHLAYLELLFKRGEIDRIDIGLKRLGGRQQSVMRGIHQLALAWSPDGKYLATGTLGRQHELLLQTMDVANGKKALFRTGLKLASTELPIRFRYSRTGRYLAMDGQFRSAEGWDVAVVDLETRKAQVLTAASEHLLAGWTPDDKLLLSSLSTVATIRPDGTGYQPIYGQGHGGVSDADLLLRVARGRAEAVRDRLQLVAEAINLQR